MRSHTVNFLLPILMFGSLATAATVGSGVREWRQAHEREILGEYFRLLALPNIASDRESIGRNALSLIHI